MIHLEGKRLNLGLDCGSITGFALWEVSEQKFIDLPFDMRRMSFWSTVKQIQLLLDLENDMKVIIEDITQIKTTFKALGAYNATKGTTAQKIGACAKVAKNVGEVIKETDLLIKFCQNIDVRLRCIKPTKKSLTKLNHETFVKITGYDKRMNGHCRDACMLVFNTK